MVSEATMRCVRELLLAHPRDVAEAHAILLQRWPLVSFETSSEAYGIAQKSLSKPAVPKVPERIDITVTPIGR